MLRDDLVARGAQVDEIPVYRTVLGQPSAEAYAALRGTVDAITFTSSSTVRNFYALLGDEGRALVARTLVACIGPITARTAREYDLPVGVVARDYTVPGLVHALTAAFSSHLPFGKT